MIGKILGHYQIVARLGKGGMGEVYLADDARLHRKVALKVLPPDLAARPDRLERFEREAQTLAALDHPNIVTIHSVEEAGGIRFLTMAYVEGQTLAELIPPEGLSADRWIELAEALADGLDAAHARGIVHRDLKPGNVMVDRAGRLRILDFGLAKLQPELDRNLDERLTETASPALTRQGTILGTYPYMSPEQAEGGPLDARSDLFSLGTLLYEMATGRQPFIGATPAALISSILKDTPRPITAIRPDLPPVVGCIIERCLQKDPGSRFQSARELRDALRDRRQSMADEGTATTGWRPARNWPHRRWVVLATVVAAVGLTTMWLTGLPGRTQPPSTGTGPQAWEQITFFPDSAVSPALSPDGRMLTFLRSPSTFFGPAEVHVKLLPHGDPMPLTGDGLLKMSPVFAPDGARVAYTVVPDWDTWIVPVFGGDPRLWLANASGLTWIDSGRVLFSELSTGLKMGLATALESRAEKRWIYLPEPERGMVHRSALSPDGRWVLAVEMDTGAWLPCRLLEYESRGSGRRIGPDGPCTHAAWSPDGAWMYFTASAGGGYHLWRQRFPDGEPERITAGPTEEEGLALEPDGRFAFTSVGIRQSTVVIVTAGGEHPISGEGYAWLDQSAHHGFPQPFSRDGSRLLFLRRRSPHGAADQVEHRAAEVPEITGELWVADVASGQAEALLPGFEIRRYDVSHDGQLIVAEGVDAGGRSAVWLARLDRGTPPAPVPQVEGDESFRFSPDGGLFFRRVEPNGSFIWYRSRDGSEMRRVLDVPVENFHAVSPDGRWLLASHIRDDRGAQRTFRAGRPERVELRAYPSAGGPSRVVCYACSVEWSPGGRFAYLLFPLQDQTVLLSLPSPASLPDLPEGGVSQADISSLSNVIWRKDGLIFAGADPATYAYSRATVQRNIFRVPLH